MSLEWTEAVTFWHWWALGVIFVILEIFSPAAFFLWLGIAAGVVGLLLWLTPGIPWEWQILAFALLSVTSIGVGRGYLRRHPIVSDRPTLNRRGEQYVGRVFTLDAPIVNGIGKVRVDDTSWKITGDDCPAGTRVQVVGVDGVVLRVDRAPPGMP